jgi:hypothetical protein
MRSHVSLLDRAKAFGIGSLFGIIPGCICAWFANFGSFGESACLAAACALVVGLVAAISPEGAMHLAFEMLMSIF